MHEKRARLVLLSGGDQWPKHILAKAVRDAGHEVLASDSSAAKADVVVFVQAAADLTAIDDDSAVDWSAEKIASDVAVLDRYEPKRVILISGIEALGSTDGGSEPRFEGTAESPSSRGGQALLARERELLALRDRRGFSLVILRCGHLYGVGEPGFLRHLGVEAAQAAPLSRRSRKVKRVVPLHVLDLARAVAASIEGGDWIYHLSSDESPDWGTLESEVRRAAEWKQYESPRSSVVSAPTLRTAEATLVAPAHRASREIGFAPEWPVTRAFPVLLEELRVPPEFRDPLRGGLREARFESKAAGDSAAEVLDAEGAFWDEVERMEPVLYARPHDWTYDVAAGNVAQAPAYRFLHRELRRAGAKTIIDLGCGSGVYAIAMAKHLGIHAIGIDLSEKKIERARQRAKESGCESRLSFEVADATVYRTPTPVDAIIAVGALHHLPDITKTLPEFCARNLKPGGIVVASEPHCEDGYHPSLLTFGERLFRTKFFGSSFDIERFLESRRQSVDPESLRTESPAGVGAHHDDFDLDRFLRTRFTPRRVRYQHFLSPFVINAFIVFQKRASIRRWTQRLLPFIVAMDGFLCRFRRFSDWAAQGFYSVRFDR